MSSTSDGVLWTRLTLSRPKPKQADPQPTKQKQMNIKIRKRASPQEKKNSEQPNCTKQRAQATTGPFQPHVHQDRNGDAFDFLRHVVRAILVGCQYGRFVATCGACMNFTTCQISFEPGFAACQSLAQKKKCPFSGFVLLSAVLRVRGGAQKFLRDHFCMLLGRPFESLVIWG